MTAAAGATMAAEAMPVAGATIAAGTTTAAGATAAVQAKQQQLEHWLAACPYQHSNLLVPMLHEVPRPRGFLIS